MGTTKEVSVKYQEYGALEELVEWQQALMHRAVSASKDAYAPYSTFSVGAALLLENGEVIIGNNQENVAYPSGLCAERVAIFAASATHPNMPIKAMAVTASAVDFAVDYPVSPCGGCRQSIAEYEHKQEAPIELILMGERGKVIVFESASHLLPLLFKEEGLKKQ